MSNPHTPEGIPVPIVDAATLREGFGAYGAGAKNAASADTRSGAPVVGGDAALDGMKQKIAVIVEKALNAQLPTAEWKPSVIHPTFYAPSVAPEIPGSSGLPMNLVGQAVMNYFLRRGIPLAGARMRDCIAGDGEPVVDITVAPAIYEEKIKGQNPFATEAPSADAATLSDGHGAYHHTTHAGEDLSVPPSGNFVDMVLRPTRTAEPTKSPSKFVPRA